MKNKVGNGTFVLIISGVICKLFGGLFRLPLTNIISIEGIGMYQMVMSLYSLALVFVSGGTTNALSKLVASARARGDHKMIGSYLRYGLIFTLSLSGLLSLFFLFFGKSISAVQGLSSGSSAYVVIAFVLPLGGLVGVARGIMQGYNNMTPTAISQIIEQVSKFAFGLLLAYLLGKSGLAGGLNGALLGLLISELLASIYLAYRVYSADKFDLNSLGKKEFFEASLPLTFGGTIIPLSYAVEGLSIVSLLAKAGFSKETAMTLYGLQSGMVGAVLNFPLIISLAVAVSLLPNLSYMASQGDTEGQKTVIRQSFLAMWFILIPLVVGIMATAGVFYPIIYPKIIDKYLVLAQQLTIFSGFSIILTAIMQFLLSLLQANGFFTHSLVFSILGGIGKLVILFVFAKMKSISIFAIPFSNIALSFIIILCVLFKIGYLIKLPAFELTLPILSAGIMFMIVKIFLSFVSGYFGLVLAIILGMAIYFILSFPLTVYYAKLVISSLKN